MEHIVLHKNSEYHSAFPHIIRLQNNELVCIFRQAILRKGYVGAEAHDSPLAHYHLDPESRIALVRSTDGGISWDPGSLVIVDESDGNQDLNMGMISQLSSGELLVNNHNWYTGLSENQGAELAGSRSHLPRPETSPYSRKWFGEIYYDSAYLLRSKDDGRTWSKREPFSIGPYKFFTHTGKDGAICMPDDSLLLPLSGRTNQDQPGPMFVVRSYDNGFTWNNPSMVAYDPDGKISFGEPSLLRQSTGRLLVMMRTNDYLYQAYSTDDGWTWQDLKRSPIWGFPAHCIELQSGRILCVYGYRREPYGVRATFSNDGGETWDINHEVIIRNDGQHRDLGYPASIQLDDGNILTIYYFHDEDGIRYIGGTIWSEEEAG